MMFFIRYPKFIDCLEFLNWSLIKNIDDYFSDPINSLFGFDYQAPFFWQFVPLYFKTVPRDLEFWQTHNLSLQ